MPDNSDPSTENRRGKKRRFNGLLILGVLLLVVIATSYRPPVPTVACNDDVLGGQPAVIMLGAWWCNYCYQARKYFNDNNISYCEYDIEQSAKGRALYDRIPGPNVPIPVLFIGNNTIIGFDQNQIDKALMELKQS